MRILHIIIGLNTGGAEIMLERLVERHVHSLEFQHEIVSLTDIGTVGQRLREKGFSVRSLGMRGLWDASRILLALYRLIRKAKPDIIQTWMIHADLIGGLAARLAGHKRILWSLHAVNISLPGTNSARWLLPLCACLSKIIPRKIVCVSKACEVFHIQKGYDPARMVVIPNGIDLAKYKAEPDAVLAFKKEAGIPEGVLVIGCVARFNGTKDIETWVRAAGLVASQMENVHFLLVGPGMEGANKDLTQWIEKTGKTPLFHLAGERSDVPVCLAAMDVFCLSSVTESFGLVVAEAMSMGIPCVVTDVDNLPYLLGDAGLIVPPRSPEKLAESLLTLLQKEPTDRAEMGRKGRARVERTFTLQQMQTQYEKLYADLCGTNSLSR